MRLEDSYARYPRAILWLVRGGVSPRTGAEVSSFYLGKEPVTNRQFEAFRPGFVRSAASPGNDGPATGLSHDDARGYCAWYARISRKPMRLPTDVEWDYACRAGASTRWFSGDDPEGIDPFCWCAENSGGRLPRLAAKRPNPFGLLALLGGVWEWTAEGGLRGGSFRTPRALLDHPPTEPPATEEIGFRIARSFAR